MTSITKHKWKYLTKFNVEHWGYLLERQYIQIELTPKDMNAIIENEYGGKKKNNCQDIIPYDLRNALMKITQKTSVVEKKWFIRLSTRSIKDSFYMMTPIPLTNHIEILERLMKSKRAYDDVKLSYKYDTPIYLFMIEWDKHVDVRHEFRCFVKNGELIGVSQYDLYDDLDYMECELKDISSRIQHFVNDIYYDEQNYVVDVNLDNKRKCHLIEINPYDKTTSAIHFSWNELNTNYTFGKLILKYRLFGCIKDFEM